MNRKDVIKRQIKLQRSVQEMGIHIVTCPDCGYVLLHSALDDMVECPNCSATDHLTEFPDLYYEGWGDEKEKEAQMSEIEAIEIVLNLADQHILEEHVLVPEMEKQKKAIDIVTEMLENLQLGEL